MSSFELKSAPKPKLSQNSLTILTYLDFSKLHRPLENTSCIGYNTIMKKIEIEKLGVGMAVLSVLAVSGLASFYSYHKLFNREDNNSKIANNIEPVGLYSLSQDQAVLGAHTDSTDSDSFNYGYGGIMRAYDDYLNIR